MTHRLLENRTAIITGAASGIGSAIAEKFAEEGANVVVSDIRGALANERAQTLRSRHLVAQPFEADASSEEAIKKLIDFAFENFQHIDIMVNNAGMQYVSPIEKFPVEKFNQLIQLMLVGPFISMKHVIPIMKKQNYGRIINLASINGLIGAVGKSAYNSAKHGLVGLTKVAALEVASHEITVNALCPGYVNTPLIQNQLADLARIHHVPLDQVLEQVIYPLVPQRRLLEAPEIAEYAAFIASDKARGITGQAVVIDGGCIAR